MTVVTHELKASYAFIERNFNLTRRYWGWELAFLVYSVAGALSISLIGATQGRPALLLSLMIGAIFWNYLSVVFSWIAETIAVERWEGTLEYTMMAPIRRSSQLLGSVAVRDGLRPDPHGGRSSSCWSCSSRSSTCRGANPATVVAFMLLGSFSFVGIGMIAAILPLLYVERGAQMTFVLQSCLLLVSGVYYPIDDPAAAGCRCCRTCRRRRTSSIDPSSINKNIRVDVPIIGDAGNVIGDLLQVFKAEAKKPDIKAWWQQIAQWRARNSLAYRPSNDVILPQYAIQRLFELTRGKDTYITTEVGQHQMWAAQFFGFDEPHRWMTSGGLGTMGYGLPAAVGVQMAHRDSLVIDIAGDASV